MFRTFWLSVLAVVLLNAGVALAAVTFQRLLLGTTTTVLTITNLVNDTRTAAGTTYDPRQGQTGQGYTHAMVECVFTFAATPTTGTSVAIWFLKSGDGTTFENTTNARLPNVVCPVTPGQTGTRVSFDEVRLPPWRFQTIALNNSTGQQLNSGTVAITPYTMQGN